MNLPCHEIFRRNKRHIKKILEEEFPKFEFSHNGGAQIVGIHKTEPIELIAENYNSNGQNHVEAHLWIAWDVEKVDYKGKEVLPEAMYDTIVVSKIRCQNQDTDNCHVDRYGCACSVTEIAANMKEAFKKSCKTLKEDIKVIKKAMRAI